MTTKQVLAASSVAVALVLGTSVAQAVDPADRCEASKVKAIGDYVACLTSLDAKAALMGAPVDPVATARCANKFLHSWDEAQEEGAGMCADPPGADGSIAQATAALCSAWATGYVRGGEADICAGVCDSCESDLATCTSDLGTCEESLTTCSASLSTCTSSLSTVQNNLATCSANFSTCETDKAQCQTDLAGSTANLSSCEATLETCQTDLTACTTPTCGDERVDIGEQCDGTNLTGDTCESLGFTSGTLACSVSCTFDTRGCEECAAVPLVNGSFDCGPSPAPPGYQTLSLGSTDVCGWVVTDENIDITTTWWVASDGAKSLDLNGTQPGAIAQTFATIPGRVYEVSFDMAGNTIELRNSTAMMQVSAAGQSASFTVNVGDYSGPPFTQMDWTRKTWSFVATAGSTTLEFRSENLSSGAGGPALDNVSVLGCSPP